ncbi:hypothetical protein Tco_0813079 [Tanacetum coccineum]
MELTKFLQDLIPTHEWLRLSTHSTSREVDWRQVFHGGQVGVGSMGELGRVENTRALGANEDIKRDPYSKKSLIRRIQSLDTPMDDPNMTMEEYIKLEEEKARRRSRVFNWQTATYGKIRDALQCKSQVSTPVNDEIDFRISIDESDDEDYIIICDKNSFSYKMISVNDLKTDSENDNEKVIPLIPSHEHAISCFGDLDFFKDFENEFPAIVYNDAQTSKSDLLTEPTLNPQHIDKFNLNDETSVSEYDEEEQNILYFNDLFHFNIIRPDDLKSKKDNDNNETDITQSSEDMALPLREQRHPFLRYQGLEYTNADIEDFEERLARIYRREVHRVQVFNFEGLPDLMAEGLSARILMEYRDDQGAKLHLDTPGALQFQLGGARRCISWRQFILALGLHTDEEMQTAGFGAYWARSARQILDKGDLSYYWIGISSAGDFFGTALSYTAIRDLILRLFHRVIACSIVRKSQAPEKSEAHISGGQFVAHLAEHFGLKTAEILGGLTIISPELPIIDMAELRVARLEEDVHEICGALTKQREVIDVMARDFSRFSTWAIIGLARMMDRAVVAYVPYSETHVPYQRRRVRQRTGEANTSTAQQDPHQPDP